NNRWALWLHIATAVAGTLTLLPYLRRRAAGYEKTLRALVCAAAVLAIAMVALTSAASPDQAIHNPAVTPLSMEEEGAGPDSLFWPSSADTSVGGTVPSEFFLSSERCGECHVDIYEQWKSSVHHFSSFNNRFYAASIEHMQEIAGAKGSRWCAGCHDHAMLFSGKFDQPAIEQLDTPEAQAGLGCVSCHSIVHVEGTMGNGGFTIEYPELHDLVASKNPLIRRLHDFLTYVEPQPHNQTF
ncbi:MAG: hypothetical protein GY953_28515, partial [bacterium]|nr:hypothetical protein [bacterium]